MIFLQLQPAFANSVKKMYNVQHTSAAAAVRIIAAYVLKVTTALDRDVQEPQVWEACARVWKNVFQIKHTQKL